MVIFWYKYVSNITWDMLISKNYLPFFWNSNLTALLYFYLLNLAIIDHENDHKLGHIHWKINWKKKR